MSKTSRYVLTLTAPDRAGLVATVASFIADQGGFITEANHHTDPREGTAFLRFAFQDAGQGAVKAALDISALRTAFAPIASTLGAGADFHDLSTPMPIVIAVSKFGHCLYDLLHRWKSGILPVEIKAVISNHEDMRSFTEWHGLPYHYLPTSEGTKTDREAQIKTILTDTGSELLVLARYMQILSEDMCRHLSGQAINIHHSFLPSFKGAKPYSQAFERGVKMIGATAHYVTADLDEGPIIEQAVERVDHSVSPGELVNIGRDTETVALSRAVRWHAERRVLLSGHRTVVFK
ncbi:MAG: formyltetrahydrofolate deformylase [Alphaproteobacteria bacterium]|nr:MAG: formyltetrahydrofolate deformylase [Alphaproteobacteria bacterium]